MTGPSTCDTFVIFGITGDLAKVASLVKEKQLTDAYQQVAVVRGGLMTRGAADHA